MSDNKWSDSRLREVIIAALEKATAPMSWISSYRYAAQYITNITVSGKFGQDIDEYLHKTYLEYNHRTEVVIIADTKMRTVEYVYPYSDNFYFPADRKISEMPLPEIKTGHAKFQQIMTNSGTMLLAYAPEINTLFVRTLFDVIRTPDNPDDKLDIEARLGL